MRCHRFEIGSISLQNGEILYDAWLSYATWGALNASADNCILFPTYFTGTHLSNARIIGEQFALNPAKWFIVVPNLIGNGLSISPSNSPYHRHTSQPFPQVTIYDNINCQKKLLDFLQVKQIKLALGWSMGAIQAWHWAVAYPEMVQNLLPICGASRCWPYNQAFIEGVRAALTADSAFANGFYQLPPEAGLRAFARAYMPWAYSAEFFRSQRYKEIGFETQHALTQDWEQDHLDWDANNLLTKLWTWQNADVSAHKTCNNNPSQALARITARTIVMPCDQDQYFTLAENAIEASLTPNAELRPIISSAGHCAGAPNRFKKESEMIDASIRELLNN